MTEKCIHDNIPICDNFVVGILLLVTVKVFLVYNISWQNRHSLFFRTTHIHQDDRV